MKYTFGMITADAESKRTHDLVRAAQELGIEVVLFEGNSLFVDSHFDFPKTVVYRTFCDNFEAKKIFYSMLIDHGVHLVNARGLAVPEIRSKLYQYALVKDISEFNPIQTYYFTKYDTFESSVSAGALSFPLVFKPLTGAGGKGIVLAHSFLDIEFLAEGEIKEYIVQPVVSNTHDYRVIIIGGKAIGVLKRSAKEGTFVNNVSAGGNISEEKDPKIETLLKDMAERIAAHFEMDVAGVDIIYDDDNDLYRFMEINIMPAWDGFNEVTGVDTPKVFWEWVISKHHEKYG